MKGNFLIAFIIATLVFSVDRYTKNWVSKNFRIGESKSVYKDYIKITHIKNPWVAWGLKIFGKNKYLYIILPAGLFILLIIWAFIEKDLFTLIFLGCLIGAGLGNLYDRIIFGEVTDFIDIGIKDKRWPVFNVADAVITTSLIIYSLKSILTFKKRRK